MRALILMAGVLAFPAATASITGVVSGCGEKQAACNEVARLQLRPTGPIASAEAALFIAVYPSVNGTPQPGMGGYFNGRAWEVSGILPRLMWAGSLRNRCRFQSRAGCAAWPSATERLQASTSW